MTKRDIPRLKKVLAKLQNEGYGTEDRTIIASHVHTFVQKQMMPLEVSATLKCYHDQLNLRRLENPKSKIRNGMGGSPVAQYVFTESV